MTLIHISGIVAIIFLLTGCQKSNSALDRETQSPSDTLVEKEILDYKISIPNDYKIKEREGPDFTVFYLTPADTVSDKFSCGIFFGNHPGRFPAPSDTCKNEILKSDILGSEVDWTVYTCGSDFMVQTIASSKSGEGWNSLAHAFGHGKDKRDVSTVLRIFSTLKTKGD